MILKSLVTVIIILQFVKCDDYVVELFQNCNATGLNCDKYRLLKFLEDFDFEWKSNGIVNLVKIPPQEVSISVPQYESDDDGFVKFFKFLKRKAILFLSTHTLAFRLPEQLDFIEGRSSDASEVAEKKSGGKDKFTLLDRKKMKKIYIILLFKLLKIKVLLSKVLFIILSVKSVLIFAALIYPWIYQGLIFSCEKVNQGWWGWG